MKVTISTLEGPGVNNVGHKNVHDIKLSIAYFTAIYRQRKNDVIVYHQLSSIAKQRLPSLINKELEPWQVVFSGNEAS